MKLYEKIILGLTAVTFCLLFFNISEKWGIFAIATWVLALSYICAGFWLFNSDSENKKIVLPIIAGIAFGLPIFTFVFYLKMDEMLNEYGLIFKFLFIPNAILCLCVSIYWIINRKTDKITIDIKNILKRSVIILVIGGFLVSISQMYVPHRIVLKAVHADNKYLLNNVLMFEYRAKSEKALKKKDYDTAIEYALKSNEAGRIWLDLVGDKYQYIDYAINSSNEDTLDVYLQYVGYDLYSIQGSYSLLYYVYRGKADNEWSKTQYKDALENYETAHKYLLASNAIQKKGTGEISKRWLPEKTWSFNSIARCYQKLRQYEMAAPLYLEAIQCYKSITEDEDNNLAILYQDMASFLSEIGEYGTSTYFYIASIGILSKDTLDNKNREYLTDNCNEIAKNYYQQDKIQEALHYLKQAKRFMPKNGDRLCYNTLYKGLCTYKLNEYQKADTILKTCLQCYENESETSKLTIAAVNKVLAQTNISLAKYEESRKYANTALAIIEEIYGKNNFKYADYLRDIALLNKITGDYSTAYQQYKQIVEIFTHELSENPSSVINVLSEFANLEIILSNIESAKQHSDQAMSMIPDTLLVFPSTTSVLNNAAYVHYCVGLYKQADTLYQKVLSINNNYNLPFSPTTAAALNGLGLLETTKKNHKKADSLFAKSLHIYTKCLSQNHPLTANIYLNWGLLQVQENKLIEAEEKISKAYMINKQFFTNDHDVFADILVAKGDIAKKSGQNQTANENYQQALNIYKKKFTNNHWKIIETERKIK